MKRWAAIGRLFNPPPSMTNLSFHMKRLWSKYLLDYERVCMQLSTQWTNERDEDKTEPGSQREIALVPM